MSVNQVDASRFREKGFAANSMAAAVAKNGRDIIPPSTLISKAVIASDDGFCFAFERGQCPNAVKNTVL